MCITYVECACLVGCRYHAMCTCPASPAPPPCNTLPPLTAHPRTPPTFMQLSPIPIHPKPSIPLDLQTALPTPNPPLPFPHPPPRDPHPHPPQLTSMQLSTGPKISSL